MQGPLKLTASYREWDSDEGGVGGVGSLEVHCHLHSFGQVQLQIIHTVQVEQLFRFASGLVIVPKLAQ